MRRAWKCVKGSALHNGRNSCFVGLLDQGFYNCRTDTPSLSGSPPVFQRRVYPIVEFCGPFVNQRNIRIDSGCGVEFFSDISRNSAGSASHSRGFSSGYAVRLSRASFATAAAAAVERDNVDTSTSVSAGAVVQPSLASLEPVGGAEPQSAFEVELTEEPGNLSHVLDLEAKLRCLRDWGLTDEELVKLSLHVPSSVRSALLKNTAKKLVEVATFLVEECGVPKLKVANALLGNVFLASSRIEDCLRPKVHLSSLSHCATLKAVFRHKEHQLEAPGVAAYLLSLGLTKEQVGKVINRCPQILTYSMEQRVLPMQRKLIECGLKMEDIGKAVVKYPGLLGTGINKIDRTIRFLKAAGVVEIAKCISRHPQILSLSLDGKVHTMTAFLKSDLLLDTEIIKKTISIQPSIFTYSVECNLRPKVIYFLSLGLGRREIGRMVSVHPAIMGHSLETSIKPKIDFLVNVMHRNVDEIVSFPQYLSYSLSSRIQPRYEYLAERKNFRLSLSSMLSCRPDIFHRRHSEWQ